MARGALIGDTVGGQKFASKTEGCPLEHFWGARTMARQARPQAPRISVLGVRRKMGSSLQDFCPCGNDPDGPSMPNICGGFHCPNVGDQAQDWFELARLLSDRKQFCGYLCTALRALLVDDRLGVPARTRFCVERKTKLSSGRYGAWLE